MVHSQTNIQVYGIMTQLTEFEKASPTHPPTDRTNSRDAVASKNEMLRKTMLFKIANAMSVHFRILNNS